MQTSKKALCVTALFILMFAAVSAVFITVYIHSDYYFYTDAHQRSESAGTLDTLYCGSSHGLCAFDPDVIDSAAGSSSYNICGAMMTLTGMKKMLELELERNPVKTVYIEVCYNTLTRDESTETSEGDIYVIPRIGSFSDRIGFIFKEIPPKNYAAMYSNMMLKGAKVLGEKILGRDHHEGRTGKGFRHINETTNYLLPPDDIENCLNSIILSSEALPENVMKLESIVNICEEHNVHIVFVAVPIADFRSWSFSNIDEVMDWFASYCSENGYEYYDFNLLRCRREIISDEYSYYDPLHFNSAGAEAFSRKFAEIMLMAQNGDDVSDLFFDSYAQYKSELPYSLYYN